MTFSIIQKSQLGGAGRLDGEFYQPEFIEFEKNLLKFETTSIGEIAFITDGQHGYHKVDPASDIRHLTARNVASWIVNDIGADKLSKETNDKNRRSILETEDLLTSTAGTIGSVGIVLDNVLPANIDQDVARIHITDKNKIDPYFLLVFLNSKYGQFQFIRETTGQIQTHLALEKIKDRIFTPIPNWQLIVSEIVKKAIENLSNSNKYYQHAENLLLEELGLKDFKIPEDLSYIVDYSDIEKVDRVDADYFQPKYEKLITILKKQKTKKFSEVIEDAPARFIPKSEEDYKYIELANINASIGVIDGFSEVLGKEAPSRARRLLKTGDVLVSSIQGVLQKTALVSEEQDGSLASTGFFQFRSNAILPEVLLILAKSIVLQWQLERECAGTILAAVPQESLKRLIIPVLSKEIQVKIAALVRKSHEARKKSKELLEEAKRKVEEMIEKGGD